jgi:hypothetical protein
LESTRIVEVLNVRTSVASVVKRTEFPRTKSNPLHLYGSPRKSTLCKPSLSNTKIHTTQEIDRVHHLFITLIQSTSLGHMEGTSASGLNQIERNDAVDHGSEEDSKSLGSSSAEDAQFIPSVVLKVIVRLCVRDARIYLISD